MKKLDENNHRGKTVLEFWTNSVVTNSSLTLKVGTLHVFRRQNVLINWLLCFLYTYLYNLYGMEYWTLNLKKFIKQCISNNLLTSSKEHKLIVNKIKLKKKPFKCGLYNEYERLTLPVYKVFFKNISRYYHYKRFHTNFSKCVY